MELDDLKSKWQSIQPQIETISEHQPKLPTKRNFEVRTKLFWRTCFAAAFTFFCLIANVILELSLPTIYPIYWAIAIDLLILLALICETIIARLVYRINLWKYTHMEIISMIIRIKKLYKLFELWSSIAITMMIGWLSMLPPFTGNRNIIYLWIILAAAFVAEYIFYKKNITYLNEIKNWDNEDEK